MINDVVYEAAAQSGNAETIQNLDKARRKTIVSVDRTIDNLETPTAEVDPDSPSFDVKDMFNNALNISDGDSGHLTTLHVSPSDTTTPWYRGLINVAMFNIRVIERYNGSSKELLALVLLKRSKTNSLTV